MMIFYTRFDIDTNGKCDKCKYYRPVIKIDRDGEFIVFARGRCNITGRYKQRTETCKKFKKAVG